VDLTVFFDNVALDSNFMWVEYGLRTRGVYPKKRKDPGENKKCFDNQATVIYKMQDAKQNTYFPNIKLFRNGSIQMTGIRSPDDGQYISQAIADEITKIREVAPSIVDASAEKVMASAFKIRMINCDFGVAFKIRRKKLHQLLISSPYNNTCSFQPVDYPGVKLQYYWNDRLPNMYGNCECATHCFGNGTGDGQGQCKKVTVSIFDSGKILITGANSFIQVNAAYKYICDMIHNNEDKMKKNMPTLTTTTSATSVKA
jgi:TATA-box binding protein (TBP) (component of TFIID and TFIIIB)